MMFRAMKEKREARHNQSFENGPINMMDSREPRQVPGYGYAGEPVDEKSEKGEKTERREKERETGFEASKSQLSDEASVYRASVAPPSYEMYEKNEKN
jgi:hypothetical protein